MRLVMKVVGMCVLLGGSLTLSGCGFAPLYAQQGLTTNLSNIAVDAPDTRTGYFVAQDLRNNLGADLSSPKPFLLTIQMGEGHFSVGYRTDETSTRSEITSTVNYTLKDTRTGKVLLKDKFTETVTYDTSQSPLTGVVSQQDAERRLATAIAQRLQNDLALYFHDAS